MADPGLALSLDEPLMRSILLPFAASALSVIAIRALLGEGRGAVLASAGIGLGLMAGLVAQFGWQIWSGEDLLAKMIWLSLGGLILGALLDRLPTVLPVAGFLMIAWPLTAILVFMAPELAAGLSGEALLRFGGLVIGAALLFVRLHQEQDDGLNAPYLLLALAGGLAAVAFAFHLSKVAEIALSVVAALAGYLVWNLGRARYPIGHAALLPAATVIIAVATILIALRNGAAFALIPLFALMFAAPIAVAVLGGRNGRGAWAITAGALVLIAAATAYFSPS